MSKPSICFMLILLLLLAADVSSALEPELIFQRSLEQMSVSGGIPDGRLILSSPDGFKILTSDGKELYRAGLTPNQGLVASEDGGFFGIATYSASTSSDFLRAQSFALFSAEGNKLWEVKNARLSDFYVSNQANLVVGVSVGEGSPASKLVFYNHAGDSIFSRKVGLLQEVSFSSDGKCVFVNSTKDGLLAFDDSGALKANFGPCERFAASPDGEYVATSSAGNLTIYHQGKPTGKPLSVSLFVREMRFSPENEYLIVIDKKNLSLFEVQTRKVLWQYSLDRPELSFVSVDLSSNARKIIAGVDLDRGRTLPAEERHTTGLVYVFDQDGKLIWSKELSYRLWGTAFPKVHFSSDGTKFSVVTREAIYFFKSD
ncbi:MAG: WD40 repeat domain-containing protein [Candidatus Zixiibacteriota bacterium]